MTFATARAELKARGFDYLSDARCNQFLNTAMHWVNGADDWPFLTTTTTGVAPLTIADVRKVLYVADTTSRKKLQSIDPRTLTDWYPALDTTGSPTWWWLDGATTMRVYPLNTADTLQVRYVKNASDLSADSDTPDLPARWHQSVWVSKAVVYAYQDSDNLFPGMMLDQTVLAAVEDMRRELLGRRGDNTEYIQYTNLWGDS